MSQYFALSTAALSAAWKLAKPNKPFSVPVGHHFVTCEHQNSTPLLSWTREAVVVANQTATVSGMMLGAIPIKFEVDTKFDGVPFAKGTSTVVKAGNYLVEVDGVKKYTDIRSACVIRARPNLDCYPLVP